MKTTVKQILGCIGKRVTFKYPGSEGYRRGVLTDRAVAHASTNMAGVPYWNDIDRIDFDGNARNPWMRVGYYRKKDILRWGSQTTLTEPLSTWKRLFVHTAKEKPWFRSFLEDVLKEARS